MSKRIICGTDVHEKTLVSKIAVGTGIPEDKEHRNTHTGRGQLITHLKRLAREYNAEEIVVAYEASTLGYSLYDDCREAGIVCYILAPTKMPRSPKDRKKKRDKEDAKRILELLRAHLLAGNELPAIWIPDDQTRDDRELIRQRLAVAHKITVIKTQVQMLLKRHGLKRPEWIQSSWTRAYCRWLERCPLEKGARFALSSLLRQLSGLEQECIILDRAVEALSQDSRYKAAVVSLTRLKGVALLTAMVYLTELGDLGRFCNRRKVGSFLGLVPSTHESGQKDDRKGHITREGPKLVRKVLCQATWARIRYDHQEAAVYGRICHKNPKHKKIAVVASMRRLAILMWHVGLEAQEKSQVFTKAA